MECRNEKFSLEENSLVALADNVHPGFKKPSFDGRGVACRAPFLAIGIGP